MPRLRNVSSVANTSVVNFGERPNEGSSRRRSVGVEMKGDSQHLLLSAGQVAARKIKAFG